MRITLTVTLAAVLFIATTAHSATIYVPDDFPTIQGAIDASADDGIVVVRPGTYVENIDFVGKAITVQSEQGAAVTTIDGNQAGSVVTFDSGETLDSVLDGFTVTNGDADYGGGIYCNDSSPKITNNTISGNAAGTGGGIDCRLFSSPIVSNNAISENMASYGGGLFCHQSSPTITNNTFTNNTGGSYGGAICFFSGSSARITFNTITGNAAGAGGGIYCNYISSLLVRDTILWDNGATTGKEIWLGSPSSPSTLTISYSDVDGGLSSVHVDPGCTLDLGAGLIDADPLFVDPANGDYHLQQDPCQPGVENPCVDTGDPSTSNGGSTRSDGIRDAWPSDMGYHDPSTYFDTIHVPDDHATIQEAIDASVSGDTVVVRPGTYVESGINFKSKAITLRSESGPEVTTIDGNFAAENVVIFENWEMSDSVLDGFTITNANASSGGIRCHNSSPTIMNNIISGNIAEHGGGGIRCDYCSPTIINNIIANNTSLMYGAGGGIKCYFSSPKIAGNTISNNRAKQRGGGIFVDDGSPTITNNIITGNSVTSSALGGGICLYDSLSVISNNIISGNSCDQRGGGIYGSGCILDITHNIISDNTSTSLGGGIHLQDAAGSNISNNIITKNTAQYSGGGISYYFNAPATITNNTIIGNSAVYGGGIHCDGSSPTITNTILWDNSAPNGPEIYGSTAVVSYCDVKGGWPGTGNIDADPLFADLDGGDYHITWGSPCLDSGDDSVVTDSLDFEGDPRIAAGVAVDMGADEYWFHLYHSGAVIPGSTIDLKVVGWPVALVTLALADHSVDPPTPTPYGDLYLPWPPLWSGNMGVVPGSGILILPVTVPAGSTPGDEFYLQALVGPWGGPTTTLTNLEVLTVE